MVVNFLIFPQVIKKIGVSQNAQHKARYLVTTPLSWC